MAKLWLVISIVILLTTACNLENNVRPAAGTPTAPPAGPPRIRIESPRAGDEFAVGEEILVAVEAADSIGVNRVQLFANNQIVRTVSSESLQGDLSLRAILNYVPQSSDIGSLSLRVLAYRGAQVSAPDEMTVTVRQSKSQITATPNPFSNIPYIPNDGICRALVNVALNFRTGPSTRFEVITVLASGTLAAIVGRIADRSWWQLNVEGGLGWVSADFTTEYGDCSRIAVTAP